MKDWKYILYAAGAIAIFVLVKSTAPKQYDWSITLAHDDKNPYGAYALHTLLPSLVGDRLRIINQTLYEVRDSLRASDNIFVLAYNFNPAREDVDALLEHVARGGHAVISSQSFWGVFADTLGIRTADYLFSDEGTTQTDSAYLKIVNASLDSVEQYTFRRENIYSHFTRSDSVAASVIARNDLGRPVAIKLHWGKGTMILNSVPLAFTNIYLLDKNKPEFAEKILSYMPSGRTWWMEYYQTGRREAGSPLRFILTNEPLRWAYYIALAALVLFMLFEAKRKQRIIPVIKPLENTSLEFVSIVGNLYFQTGDHADMARKRILFLLEQIRSQYGLSTKEINASFLEALANKSGCSLETVTALFRLISYIQSSTAISTNQLIDLNEKIEAFNNESKNKTH